MKEWIEDAADQEKIRKLAEDAMYMAKTMVSEAGRIRADALYLKHKTERITEMMAEIQVILEEEE